MKVPEPRKLPSGNYFIQLRLNGVSVPVTAPTAKECKRTAELIKAEHRAEKRAIAKNRNDITLREACERYIEKKERAGRSPATIRGYDIILRNHFQAVMDRKVSSIKNWQALYDSEAENAAPKTMQNVWAFVKAACKTEAGTALPDIEAKAPERNEHPFLDPEQVKVFISVIKGNKYEIPMLLALSSWRSSEICALDWKNVDLANNRIRVRGAVVRDKHNQAVEKAKNKTKDSSRYVPIFMPELRSALEAVPEKSGKVVTAAPNTIYRQINAVCKKHGLPDVGIHGLRHSFASLAYSLNIPIKVTMQIGGWSDYNTMLKIYTHLSQKDIAKHSANIAEFFETANKNANET